MSSMKGPTPPPEIPLAYLRERKPLIQCITNFVSMDFMANALNAIGASPAMVHCVDEVEEFAKLADALVVNVGTLSKDWLRSMELAAASAREAGKPWVLDPVGAGATKFRTQAVMSLLDLKPTLLRGNASEILALAGAGGVTRGVDSTSGEWIALLPAMSLAKKYDIVVAVSGKDDLVTDGQKILRVSNGVEMLTKITAAGCSVTAVIAAFLAVTAADHPDDKAVIMHTAAHALAYFGVAGEEAHKLSKGPGSLRVNLIDQLYNLDDSDLETKVSIESR